MTAVALAVVSVWVLLCGSAYLARIVARRSRRASAAIVTLVYAALAVAALGWFGLDGIGALAIGGMLVPLAAGVAFAMSPYRTGR